MADHVVERRLEDLGYSPERLNRMLDEAWLGLGDTTALDVPNPFDERTSDDLERPHRFVMSMMRQPENFGFTCKHLMNVECHPFQLAVLRQYWTHAFPMFIGSRGASKSYLNALYILLRATISQGSKIVIVGAGFRQAKVVFEYLETIWYNAPILRDICSGTRNGGPKRDIDRCTCRIGDSFIAALPIGNGEKIRGQRASILVSDEFSSQNPNIFEEVISGFASVSLSPVQKAKATARRRMARALGVPIPLDDTPTVSGLRSNQTILSGTASYGFNHFCDYWKRYKAIIESGGDPEKVSELFGGEAPAKFDYRDYCIIRLPVGLLPEDYMDEVQVAKQKVTLHRAKVLMEYETVFAEDSSGFFRRSLIEACVAGKPESPIVLPSGEVNFTAKLRGDKQSVHVIGVDPASESDNFSIVVLEVFPDHRRAVHCWTTNNRRHKARLKKGLAHEHDFYHYAARRIRELMVLFPCPHVSMDAQGGGGAVLEALGDPARCLEGEMPVFAIPDPAKPRDSDTRHGLHVVEMVQFARAEWVSEANHGMRFDMESRILLFPAFDPVAVGLAIEEDKALGRGHPEEKFRRKGTRPGSERLHDTLEDCMSEIEEMKEELASIVHSATGNNGRERWDVPEVRGNDGSFVRAHKDRYSSLLMANMAARQMSLRPAALPYSCMGGFVRDILAAGARGHAPSAHRNPHWYESGMAGMPGPVPRRR